MRTIFPFPILPRPLLSYLLLNFLKLSNGTRTGPYAHTPFHPINRKLITINQPPKFQVDYKVLPDFVTAFQAHIGHLKRMGERGEAAEIHIG